MHIRLPDETGRYAVAGRENRSKAMQRAIGYKRIAQRAKTVEEREKWLSYCRRSVKTARAANRLLVSWKQFQQSLDLDSK